MDIRVVKRAGHNEPFSNDKVNKPVLWACENLEKAYPSQILMRAKRLMEDGITTDKIHDSLIRSAVELISPEAPDNAIAAGRLLVFQMRKRAFGQFEVPHLYDHVVAQTEAKRYDQDILKSYSRAEFEIMNNAMDHSRDMNLPYISVRQLEKKYLLQDRVTGQLFESIQTAYMLISAVLFSAYPPADRMDYVLRFYNAVSLGKISLPTPITAGVRTPTRQFSSCVLIDSGDSLDSINASTSAIVKYISQRSGIGINGGRIRAKGSSIRNGEAEHTGLIPFYQHFQSAVSSCSQGAVRKGSATLYYPIWHLEFEDLIVLKNNKGTEENRCRKLDYGVQINAYLYQRLKDGKNITLFSPSDVPGLYEAFFQNQQLFARLYEEYETDTSIRRRVVPAGTIFGLLASERASTGRIYVMNVDHCNNGPFDAERATIYQSNLCAEVALPTKPLNDVNDPEGEIALCTLAAFNVGVIDDLDELEELSDLIVRALDALLDYQNYPLLAGRNGGQGRRSLGVGVTGFATYLAKRGAKYSDGSGIKPTHELFESMQYFLLKASNRLAQELGTCSKFGDTTYADGVLPIDRYAPALDSFVDVPLLRDWASLRVDILDYGLRNSTLTAIMPCETSSAVTNSVNGIEPPRGLVTIKGNKDAIMPQLVPHVDTLGDKYELAWSMGSNRGYLQLIAVMQKFVDQTISANTYHDPAKYPNGKVPVQTILKEMLYAHLNGVKTLYYHNTRDGNDEAAIDAMDTGCEGGACKL